MVGATRFCFDTKKWREVTRAEIYIPVFFCTAFPIPIGLGCTELSITGNQVATDNGKYENHTTINVQAAGLVIQVLIAGVLTI